MFTNRTNNVHNKGANLSLHSVRVAGASTTSLRTRRKRMKCHLTSGRGRAYLSICHFYFYARSIRFAGMTTKGDTGATVVLYGEEHTSDVAHSTKASPLRKPFSSEWLEIVRSSYSEACKFNLALRKKTSRNHTSHEF